MCVLFVEIAFTIWVKLRVNNCFSEEAMVIKNVALETVCGITSKLPENQHMEFAFAGKSNVGKSSLINGLMNRKSLARTSAQPGKTQTINYYNINDELYQLINKNISSKTK